MAHDLRAEMIAHARETSPDEACGLIAGRNGVATRVIRLPNVAEDRPRHYLMDGDSLHKALASMERAKETDAYGVVGEPLAIYHSHVRSVAYPSPTDLAEMQWPFSYYVLVSLRWGDPELRAFWVEDGMVTEVFPSA